MTKGKEVISTRHKYMIGEWPNSQMELVSLDKSGSSYVVTYGGHAAPATRLGASCDGISRLVRIPPYRLAALPLPPTLLPPSPRPKGCKRLLNS